MTRFKDGQAGGIAELFELLAVFGNVAALIDFQAAQSQIVAPDAGLEAVGVAGRLAPVDRLRLPQFTQAACPQRGMLLFRKGHAFERLLAPRLRLSLGKRAIGVMAGHLRLPVLFQNLAQPRVTGQSWRGLETESKASPVHRLELSGLSAVSSLETVQATQISRWKRIASC